MTGWRDLWRQRLRWQRGALENVSAYGLTRTTALYWAQQLEPVLRRHRACGPTCCSWPISLLAADNIRWSPFWVAIGLRVPRRTTWSPCGRSGGGAERWQPRSSSSSPTPAFSRWCFVISIVQMATGRKAGWNYVPRPANHRAPPALRYVCRALRHRAPDLGAVHRLVPGTQPVGGVQHTGLRGTQPAPAAAPVASRCTAQLGQQPGTQGVTGAFRGDRAGGRGTASFH